jgi:SAM-dependent methyltransferase
MGSRSESAGRARWTERHRTAGVPPPSPFVIAALARLGTPSPPAPALDLACGRGRHALVLAAAGYDVVAVDWALPALATLRQAATARGLQVHAVAADVTAWPLPRARFALVLATNFLERALFPALRAAVAPGGALVVETFLRGQERYDHPTNPAYLLRPGELAALVAGWRVVHAHEGPVDRDGSLALMAGIAAVVGSD